MTNNRFTAPLAAGVLAVQLLVAVTATGSDSEQPSASPQQQERTHIIVVRGVHGTESYREDFAEWSRRWQNLAQRVDASFRLIGEPLETKATTEDASTAPNPASSSPGDAESDKRQLLQTLRSLPPDSRKPVWLVLIGHGTSLRDEHKFNLRGPDITAAELAEALDDLQRPTAIINAASSSGPFLPALSGPNRVVVTATQSGTEKNATRFGKFFSQAVASGSADLDHDRAISILEAFTQASAEVRRAYEQEGRILTEHALIDDNGDQRGTPGDAFRGLETIAQSQDARPLDGQLASRITLPLTEDPVQWTDKQLARRDRLETALRELRSSQTEEKLDEAAYDEKLEAILVPLAKLYQEVEGL